MKRGITPITDDNELGELIYKARERKGMSSPELADRAGIHRNTMHRLQIGEIQQPRPAVLTRIAEALDLAPSRLYEAAGYSAAPEAATLEAWLNVRHRELPPEAVHELTGHLDYLVNKHRKRKEET